MQPHRKIVTRAFRTLKQADKIPDNRKNSKRLDTLIQVPVEYM